MKTKLLTFVLPVFAGAACGQVNVDVHSRPKKITIETDIKIDSVEMIVPRGKYFLEVVGANSYTMKKGLVPYNPLSTDILKDGEKGIAPQIGKNKTNVRFGSSTEYTIIAVTNDSVPQQRKYVLRSQSDWSWTTTLGANAVIFTNRSKYLSKEENGIHSVTEMQDSKSMELMPAIMFTLMNSHDNFSFGYTGGIGFNFEELAVFTGFSIGIGQNLILTGGVAIHKQNRPNSDYSIGQEIENSIAANDLNKQQYRFNPFLGISFRFNKNPFKTSNN